MMTLPLRADSEHVVLVERDQLVDPDSGVDQQPSDRPVPRQRPGLDGAQGHPAAAVPHCPRH
jgi:hypothetical protein